MSLDKPLNLNSITISKSKQLVEIASRNGISESRGSASKTSKSGGKQSSKSGSKVIHVPVKRL